MRKFKMKGKIFTLFMALIGVVFTQSIVHFENWSSVRHPNVIEKWGDENYILGSSGGAVVYNSATGIQTIVNATQGMADLEVTCILPIGSDKAVLGTINGYLYIYDKKNDVISEKIDDIAGKSIVDISKVGDTLWVLNPKSVAVFIGNSNDDSFIFKDSYSNFPFTFTNMTSMKIHDGFVYLGSDAGLLRGPTDIGKNNLKDQNVWSPVDFILGVSHSVIDFGFIGDTLAVSTPNELFVLFDNFNIGTILATGLFNKIKVFGGKLYTCREENIYQFKHRTNSQELIFVYSGVKPIKDFVISDSHQFYLTSDGLRDAKNAHQQVYFSKIPENINGEITKTANGNFYVATSPPVLTRVTGVYRFNPEKSELFLWRGIGNSSWFRANAVRHVKEVLPGVVLMCTWGGGFWIIDENEDKYFVMNTIEGEKELLKISFSANKRDTVVIDSEKIITLPNVLSDISASEDYAIVSYVDRDNTNNYIWLTQFIPRNKVQILGYPIINNSVNWADTASILKRSVPASYRDELHSIEADMWGTIWVGSAKGGVAYITFENLKNGSSSWKILTTSDGLTSNDIRYIQSDKDGYVWIGTASGINVWSGSDLFKGREEAQPIGLTINQIFIDQTGNRWFATDKGISMLKYFATPWQTPDDWVHYYSNVQNTNFSHATPVNLPNTEVKSVFLDEKTGTLYASTYKGLVSSKSLPAISNKDEKSRPVAFPNPFVSENSNLLRIKNLQAGASVKILSLNGILVRELRADTPGEFDGYWAVWNGKDGNGNPVPSGVYIFVAVNEDQTVKKGKIIVIHNH